MQQETKQTHLLYLIGWTILAAALAVLYFLGFMLTEPVDYKYAIFFLTGLFAPLIAYVVLFLIKKDSPALSVIAIVGILIPYAWMMLTKTIYPAYFAVVLPLSVLFFLFKKPIQCLLLSICAVLCNAYSVYVGLTEGNAGLAIAQILILVLFYTGLCIGTSLYSKRYRQDMKNNENIMRHNNQTKVLAYDTIEATAITVDDKDVYTKGRSLRVADYAANIARRMGLPEDEIEKIHQSATVHDIGKIGVLDELLLKPGALSPEERFKVQQHTVTGSNILKHVSDLPHLAVDARCHHERYDGTGYPDGLKGEEIPLSSRIIAIADSFDAMASDRPFRSKLPPDVIHKEIEKGIGKQFDPEIARIALEMIDRNELVCGTSVFNIH